MKKIDKGAFLNKVVSPYIDLKGGMMTDYTFSGTGWFVSPSIGISFCLLYDSNFIGFRSQRGFRLHVREPCWDLKLIIPEYVPICRKIL